MAGPVQRIVLAYSGGLDTSVILRWLVERYRAEVVAFSADLGQAEELAGIAPWREWDMKGRADLIAYAEQHRIPVAATAEKPYSSDRNLLHVSYEGGLLEDPWRAPYDDMFQLTVAPERAPDRAEEIEVDLDAGVPVAVNGERLAPAALLARLNALAGGHGVGRVDVVARRYDGLNWSGVCV